MVCVYSDYATVVSLSQKTKAEREAEANLFSLHGFHCSVNFRLTLGSFLTEHGVNPLKHYCIYTGVSVLGGD